MPIFTKLQSITKMLTLVFLAFSLQMCNVNSSDKLVLDLNTDVEQVLVKYKADLKTESISITPLTKKDTAHWVHIVIIEPQNIPNNDASINLIAMEMAKSVYQLVNNKNDFLGIEVEIAFKEEYFCDAYRRIINSFSNDELLLALKEN